MAAESKTARSRRLAKEAQSWWAKSAYNGQDRDAALAALEVSGLPSKSVIGSQGLISAMARGDALIKGAAGLAVPRRKGVAPNARYFRLLQWRLVMSYAGLEVFTKALLGRHGHGDASGLRGSDFEKIFQQLKLSILAPIEPPKPNNAIRRWLGEDGGKGNFSEVAKFMNLNGFDQQVLLEWLHGTAVTNHTQACQLAKAIRNATAHGFLSPAKCRDLGFTEALKSLPKHVHGIRVAAICRLYECHLTQTTRPGSDR